MPVEHHVGRYALAIDIGGTKLAAGVVDDSGAVLVRDRVPTPPRDVWQATARLVRRVLAASPVEPAVCGIGCGGPMDAAAGTVSPLHIPSWRAFPLREFATRLTGLPTVVDNDAKAIVLAEAWLGAARGHDDVLGMVIGTGVGGGIISRGRLLGGHHGNAGHIGHVVVEPDGRPCRCGGFGCLEAYCSGVALEAETGRSPQRASLSIKERTGTLVGRAIASVAAVLDLRLAVVGGSVALGFGEPFFTAAQAELDSRAQLSFTVGTRIIPVSLGPSAPLIGAGALAFRAPGPVGSGT